MAAKLAPSRRAHQNECRYNLAFCDFSLYATLQDAFNAQRTLFARPRLLLLDKACHAAN